MKNPRSFFLMLTVVPAVLFFSCRTSRGGYDPAKKYPRAVLRSDYSLFRNILEDSHPSLYWYTSRDSIDRAFDEGYASIPDSMTEIQFRFLLSYVVSRIDCGHTGVRYSKAYDRYTDTAHERSFPLAMKCWGDTMVVTANLDRSDSIFRRGIQVTSINEFSERELRDSLFNYVTTDGHSQTGKFQTLSTGFNFASLYKHVFGLTDNIRIGYIDSLGRQRETTIHPFDFRADTLGKQGLEVKQGVPQKKKREPNLSYFLPQNLQLDTTMKTAFMTLNTFDRSNHLRRFFRKGFAEMKKDRIRNLIIDVRSNGGGDAGISTVFTRYLIAKPFRLADSLYALHRHSRYSRYMSHQFFPGVLLPFVTTKKSDGHYHFGYFERHFFKPFRKDHFDGDIYILIGGNSFSATTLFAGALKGQSNVTLVGEETGGGYYGNTAWIIPDVTLPDTKIRFRLPRFRMVLDKSRAKDGRGIIPDVYAVPTADAIRRGIDFKLAKVRDLIEARHPETANHQP